jgi:hypothetical protein
MCPSTAAAPLPTRVLAVSQAGEGLVRLHTSTANDDGSYAALSYCWGGPQPDQTVKSNVETYAKGIQTKHLPKTIQDAILVTWKLGIPYLWIDSLCIIQDDQKDKEIEITMMRAIYENAALTISAASAERSTDGFLHTRLETSHPVSDYGRRSIDYYRFIKLPYACPDGRIGCARLAEGYGFIKVDEPISSRAWTLQETMLSSRVLQYSWGHLVWRCRSSFKTAGGTLDWKTYKSNCGILSLLEDLPVETTDTFDLEPVTQKYYPLDEDTYLAIKQDRKSWPLPRRGLADLTKIQDEWLNIVEMYSRRSMTDSLDKFPALAGIAEKFKIAFNDDDYYAGLWADDLLVGLSWCRAQFQGKSVRPYVPSFGSDHEDWCAPTWSWASVVGPVSYALVRNIGSRLHRRADVGNVEVNPRKDNSLLERLFLGKLSVRGWLRPVDIEPLNSYRDMPKHGDVFILENNNPEERGMWGSRTEAVTPDTSAQPKVRCGTAILDESIEAMPYKWTHAHDLDEIYALTLFSSVTKPREEIMYQTHGLLLVKWPIGNYNRIGWFTSYITGPDGFLKWFDEKNNGIHEIM